MRKSVTNLSELIYLYAIKSQQSYLTNHVIFVFGDDFAHPKAHLSYELMDEIIRVANRAHPDFIVKYSTAQEYFDKLRMSNADWPVYTEDLTPYFTDQGEYWSGYFTTDPSFKNRVHDFTQIVRSTMTINSLRSLAGDEHSS
jgi:Glycosyl hydrolases family 38 N-terminal domain